jgi:hypothetical protein
MATALNAQVRDIDPLRYEEADRTEHDLRYHAVPDDAADAVKIQPLDLGSLCAGELVDYEPQEC